MKLAEVLDVSRVRLDLTLTSKKRTLEEIADLLASGGKVKRNDIHNALVGREKLGSTGLGHGVAIPHGRVPDLDDTIAAFVRLPHGVDYDAHDGQAVDLVFGLVVPQKATESHLKLLAAVAERFSDEQVCQDLRAAKSAEALHEILVGG